MFVSLPGFLRIPLACLLLLLNTLGHVTPLFLWTAVRLVVPVRSVRNALAPILVAIAESWLSVNGWLFGAFTRTT